MMSIRKKGADAVVKLPGIDGPLSLREVYDKLSDDVEDV